MKPRTWLIAVLLWSAYWLMLSAVAASKPLVLKADICINSACICSGQTPKRFTRHEGRSACR